MQYTIRLIKKVPVAVGTMAFYFEKPGDFHYIAGQYADFTLIDPPETDDEGNKRTFSLASAPFEPHIMITTRLRDTAFKRVLKGLALGSTLQLEGPFGSLILPKDSQRPAVFLTGGVGATMVRSILQQAAHDNQQQPIVFIYANRTPQDAIYLEEFTELAATNSTITFVPTMTEQSVSQWHGQRGPIDINLLTQHVTDVTLPVYYLSGSGEMIGDMRRMLMAAGVERTSIRADQFIGY